MSCNFFPAIWDRYSLLPKIWTLKYALYYSIIYKCRSVSYKWHPSMRNVWEFLTSVNVSWRSLITIHPSLHPGTKNLDKDKTWHMNKLSTLLSTTDNINWCISLQRIFNIIYSVNTLAASFKFFFYSYIHVCRSQYLWGSHDSYRFVRPLQDKMGTSSESDPREWYSFPENTCKKSTNHSLVLRENIMLMLANSSNVK